MMFQNRREAGERLSRLLERYRNAPDTLILAIPRGGVPVAEVVARRLSLPLDVIICQKLKAPWDPELAMGALTETGAIHINEPLLSAMGLPGDVLIDEIREQKWSAAIARDRYRSGKALPSLRDKVVLVVDDGVATGASMLAAVSALRALGARRVVGAVPAGHLSSLRDIRRSVDELAVLERVAELCPVRCHYRSSEPVTEQRVIEALAPHRGETLRLAQG